jgi:hypothetical protein
VAFGPQHPQRYGVLFSERRAAAADYCTPVPIGPDGRPVLEFGAETFALLAKAIEDCVAAGASASTDILADATAMWVAMHGTVTLRTTLPRFPWPDPGSSSATSCAHWPGSGPDTTGSRPCPGWRSVTIGNAEILWTHLR